MTETEKTEKYFEGWAEQLRFASKGKLAFIDLYRGGDPSCKLQVVISGTKESIKELGLSRHCALKLWGKLVTSVGKGQDEEVQTTTDKVQVIGPCDQDKYPIAKTDLSLQYLRTIPAWRSRTKLFRSVFLIRDLVIRSIHDYFGSKDYIHVHTPLITKSDCEGAGEAFRVVAEGCDDFFGTEIPVDRGGEKIKEKDENDGIRAPEITKAYLTVSGQLQGEILAAGLGPVYTLGPTFRAEKSKTNRHLSEFIMSEPEIPFADLQDIIKISVEMLKHISQYVLTKGLSSLKILEEYSPGLLDKLEKFIADEPVIMTYTEAIVKLVKSGVEFEEKPEWGIDLNSEHETWLCGDSLTILTDYPKDIKAFYMYENDNDAGDNRKTVACMDVLLPQIGEVIGGSQRESRLEILAPKMERLGLGGPEYDFYRDLRKFGYAGSSGFGLGVERMIRFVTGIAQIRDVIPFPVAYGKIHA